MKKTTFVLIITVLLVLAACKKDKLGKWGTSKSFDITSANTGTTYTMTVFYPGNEFPTTPTPVVYVLDGFWWKDMTAQTVTELSNDGEIPKCIVVSLDYKSHRGPYDRGPDLIYPGEVEEEAHADKFYRFMVDELVPKIESEYLCDTAHRVLFGHSYGGLFTLFSMFDNAGQVVFNKRIAASVSIGTGNNNYLFTKEAETATKVNDIPVTLFMGCGTYIVSAPAMLEEMYKRLKARNYPNLKLGFQTYPEQHGTDPYPVFKDGLRFVFNN